MVDGQDVRQVYEVARRLVERLRNGDGPAFLICNTYRFRGHHVGDIDRAYYRSKEEEETWKSDRDPLKLLSDWLMDKGMADQAVYESIEKETKTEIDHALQFALQAPFPELSEVDQHVYA